MMPRGVDFDMAFNIGHLFYLMCLFLCLFDFLYVFDISFLLNFFISFATRFVQGIWRMNVYMIHMMHGDVKLLVVNVHRMMTMLAVIKWNVIFLLAPCRARCTSYLLVM